MTALGSRVTMQHLCTVQRNAGASDSWGGQDQNWQDHLTDQACLGWFTSEQLVIAPGELAGVASRRLALPLGTDVLETDRIGDVTYRGAVVLDGPHTIDEIITWSDRIELVLRRAA